MSLCFSRVLAMNVRCELLFQLIDSTHRYERSEGARRVNAFPGHSLRRRVQANRVYLAKDNVRAKPGHFILIFTYSAHTRVSVYASPDPAECISRHARRA